MSTNKEVKIYIATHKELQYPYKECYIPIQVGADINKKLNYMGDNTGDNISKKNKNYCELTALYWIWKNSEADIVGLEHYRRYLYKNIFSNKAKNLLSKEDIIKTLNKYDIILPKPMYMSKNNVKEQFAIKHNVEDLQVCKEIIKEIYPEYEESFDKVMNSHHMYTCNMVITKKEIFNDYMKWLFDILFEVEKRVDISKYSDYNKRIYGFLSERLFNVWLDLNNKFLIKETAIYNIEENFIKQFLQNIKRKIKRIILK